MGGLYDERLGAAWRGVAQSPLDEQPLGALGAVTTAITEPIAHALGTRAPSRVEAPELPPVGPNIAPVLTWLYGDNQEHWEESPSSMVQTPDGQERFLGWKQLIQNDPEFQDRRAQLAAMYPDPAQGESYWNHAILEYKEARKRDAATNRTDLGATAGLNLALTVFPALRTFKIARGAGAGKWLAAQTAVTTELEGLAVPFTMASKVPGLLLRNPRQLGYPAVGAALGYARTGDVEGAAQGAFWGAAIGGRCSRDLSRGARDPRERDGQDRTVGAKNRRRDPRSEAGAIPTRVGSA